MSFTSSSSTVKSCFYNNEWHNPLKSISGAACSFISNVSLTGPSDVCFSANFNTFQRLNEATHFNYKHMLDITSRFREHFAAFYDSCKSGCFVEALKSEAFKFKQCLTWITSQNSHQRMRRYRLNTLQRISFHPISLGADLQPQRDDVYIKCV